MTENRQRTNELMWIERKLQEAERQFYKNRRKEYISNFREIVSRPYGRYK